jgi:hypothetical protein
MVRMVKDKEAIIQEAVKRYEDPLERGAYVLGYVSTVYPERKVELLKEAVRPHLERGEAWAVKAFKEGARQALWDVWEEVQPTPEDMREVYGLVDKGVLSVDEATLLLRVRKDPKAAEGRERLVEKVLAKLRERPKA